MKILELVQANPELLALLAPWVLAQVRTLVPARHYAALGVVGKLLDVLVHANHSHAANAPKVRDEQGVVTKRP